MPYGLFLLEIFTVETTRLEKELQKITSNTDQPRMTQEGLRMLYTSIINFSMKIFIFVADKNHAEYKMS